MAFQGDEHASLNCLLLDRRILERLLPFPENPGPPAAQELVLNALLHQDGMARMPDLKEFAEKHHIKIATVADLIRYRMKYGLLAVTKVAEANLPTAFGSFKAIAFESNSDKKTHMALVKGDISPEEAVLVRVHSECLTGDVFGSLRCDCGNQLHEAMAVPAHDQRDFEFARKYDLPLKVVITPDGEYLDPDCLKAAYTAPGLLFHSGQFSHMNRILSTCSPIRKLVSPESRMETFLSI